MDAVAARAPGSVIRVNGPLVEVAAAPGASMLEVMAVGPQRTAPRSWRSAVIG